jgi:hypothetical protein
MVVAAMMAMPWASAQYVFNPANADEQTPGIRYFGSAKDDNGSMLPGVVIRLDTPAVQYVLFTDEQGRFRKKLPVDALPEAVTATCAKPGFQLVRVTKRPGQGPRPSVQIDCLLRATSAK